MSYRSVLSLAAIAALTLACGIADAGTRIYKTVDEDGNVIFTDVPPLDKADAEQVDVNVSNTFTAPQSTGEDLQVWTGEEGEAGEAVTEFAYVAAEIVTPANDAALRDNAGNVSVKTRVHPNLRPGHKLRLLVDETPLGRPISASEFALSNVDRGTHTLGLQIIDQAGEVIFDGPRTTFHLQRVSVQHRPQPVRPN